MLGATFLAVWQLQDTDESLDTRQQAMVIDGSAEIDLYPFANSTFKVGEATNLDLRVNTKDKSVDAIELFFEIQADDDLFDTNNIRFLDLEDSEIEVETEVVARIHEASDTNDRFFVGSIIVSSKDLENGFSTHDQLKTIGRLAFTPKKEGDFRIIIMEETSVLDHEDGSDILNNPGLLEFSYYVSKNGIDPAQCHYVYTAWDDCENYYQTREYKVEPANCYWHETEALEELSRKCEVSDGRGGIVADPEYFYLYTFEKCWNYANRGSDLHILWNEEKYQDVTWVDVSASPSFSSFYHKETTGTYETNDFRIMNASNFTGATDDVKGQTLSFEPNQNYYFRLWNEDGDDHYVSSVRFYMTYCSGDQSDYLNCNARCGEGTDNPEQECADGLSCHAGYCRLETNLENEICLDQAGIRSLNKDCNEYCADNSECASNLTCYWNHCRLPEDPTDSQCSSTTTSTTTSTSVGSPIATTVVKTYQLPSEAGDIQTYACNHGCNTNRDCQADYRCYQGQCRLASNPESMNCDADEIIEPEETASDSAEIIKLSATPTQELTPTPTTKRQGLVLSNFQAILQNVMSKFNWQWLALAGLILLIAIALIILGISQGKMTKQVKKAAIKKTPITPPDAAQTKLVPPVKTVKIPENKPTEIDEQA